MLRIFEQTDDLFRAAADFIVEAGRKAIDDRGEFHLFLSGGRTPRSVYELLARELAGDPDFWNGTHLYWGDERCVSLDNPASNYRMACEALIHRVPIRPSHVHRMQGEDPDPQRAALWYEWVLPERPDLILLGLGDDGHIASLFPGSPALDEQTRPVLPGEAPSEPRQRLTITPPVLNSARQLLLLVTGSEKAPAVRSALADDGDFRATPARLVREAVWFVDGPAAADLPPDVA